MIACYIIYSPKLDKFYSGVTQESIETRIQSHNTSKYKNKYTTIVDDWELFYSIECESLSQAVKIEKHLKRMKSRVYFQNLRLYSELSLKLLEKYVST